ncbi:MAG: translation initiation factor [Verrucomicrobiales bacterium]|jgi:translation initiation factor 1|nr:translation initiation factor [Verrucomicrobiales bacterium]
MAKREDVKKIDVSGNSGGLQNPFAALSRDGLPEGQLVEPLMAKPAKEEKPAKKGRVVLRRETAHRSGKAVIVVGDIPANIGPEEIDELARHLRKSCGCGGTVREREIEIQGDQPEKICALLEDYGFRVAGVRSGR